MGKKVIGWGDASTADVYRDGEKISSGISVRSKSRSDMGKVTVGGKWTFIMPKADYDAGVDGVVGNITLKIAS